MDTENKRSTRNVNQKDAKRLNALDSLIAAKRDGVKRVDQYEQEKFEAKNTLIENEDSMSSLDSFIERDPTVDRYYREVEDFEDEEEIDENPHQKRIKKQALPSASNQAMALLRFQSIPNQVKKTEAKKEKKPAPVVEKVNLDDLWEKVTEDAPILNQNDASYLMLSETEKQLRNYDMVIIKPKVNTQGSTQMATQASTSAQKRKRDIIEEMNQRKSDSPVRPVVKGNNPHPIGQLHTEVNQEDSNTFKELLESGEFDFEPRIQKPREAIPEEDSDSILIEQAFENARKEEQENNLKNTWATTQQSQEIIAEEALGTAGKNDGNLPMEDEYLWFYYIDAWEDQREHPGMVYLFGKIRSPKVPGAFESCCIAVRNVSRILYVVPSEYKRAENTIAPDNIKVDFMAIMNEFKNKLSSSHQQKLSFKVVDRTYSFEMPILHGKRKYLKVKYDGFLNPISENLSGKTFSHVIGTSWSLLENLIIKKEIKGPQWIKIKNPEKVSQGNKKSWCSFECNSFYEDIIKCEEKEQRPNPPLRVMTIAMKTVRNGSNFEISNISAIKFHKIDTDKNVDINQKDTVKTFFSIIRKLPNQPLPNNFEQRANKQGYKIKIEETETALINNFIAQVCDFDPDIITSHDAYTQVIEVLLNRIRKLRISNWGKLSRLRKTGSHPEGASIYRVRYSTCGRLICDTFLSAREFVRETDYNLTHLAKSLLGERREDFDQNSSHLFYRDSDLLIKMVDHTTQDAYLTSCIMFKLQIIPLTKHLTCIAGNSWARSLQNARAERNEMLLIHEFHNKKFIYPDKRSFKNEERVLFENDEIQEKTNKKKDKKKYAGGLVLEPKVGLYNDIILLLDFNSLYPSIIQEYNICFTTIERPPSILDKKSTQQNPDAIEEEINPDDIDFTKLRRIENEDSILPKVIKSLVQQRRDVKKLLKTEKNEAKIQSLDIKQKAIKLVANSMYGCLGFSSSRFYAKPLAASITRYGRQILEESVQKVQDKIGKEVIYGDTDSIMINAQSNSIPEAIVLGNKIKKEINEKYKCLEIEIDGIFLPLLLVKKKKYAAMKLDNLADFMSGNLDAIPRFKQEVKGLDMVRRDWCVLSKKASGAVLAQVLARKGLDEMFEAVKNEMTKLSKKIRGEEGGCTLKDFTITKQLTKDPAKYPDIKGQPHVVIAKRLLEKGVQANALINHYIPYVIIKNDRENLGDKACHPDEFVQQKEPMELDIEWYITQQVMPPIQRLLQVIPGVLISEVAICLGVDGNRYKNIVKNYRNDEEEAQEQVESYYNSVMNPSSLKDDMKLEFKLKCQGCKEDVVFTPVTKGDANLSKSPYICPKCQVGDLNLKQLMNQIKLKVREQIESYYLHTMRDANDGKIIKTLLLGGQKIEEKKSKDVLVFLRGVKASFQKKNVDWNPEHSQFADQVTRYIDDLLSKSKFETISLDKISNLMRINNIP